MQRQLSPQFFWTFRQPLASCPLALARLCTKYSKEVTKERRPDETLEETLKGSKDQDLKKLTSEPFDTCRVNTERISSEEISALEVAKCF